MDVKEALEIITTACNNDFFNGLSIKNQLHFVSATMAYAEVLDLGILLQQQVQAGMEYIYY